MQKKKNKAYYRLQSALTHPVQPPSPTTHTYCDASWNTENPDMREAAEQSAEGAELCVVGRPPSPKPPSHPSHPSQPHPAHTQANGVLTYRALPDTLKPVVPGDEQGREARGGGHIRGGEWVRKGGGILPGAPGWG